MGMNQTTAIDIESLTTAEKLGLMELLWRDLSREPENIEVPEWHLKALEAAEQAVADGTDQFIDLDEFEAELRDRIRQRKTE